MAFRESGAGSFVRIPVTALSQLRIEHQFSALDATIAVGDDHAAAADLVTGYTEWVGSWDGAQVSLGWDWARVNGRIVALNPAEIRTNIQLIAADGSPHSPILTRMYLHEWLETLSWRVACASELTRGEGSKPT